MVTHGTFYDRCPQEAHDISKGTFGTVRPAAYRRYYRYQTLHQAQYDINTGTRHFVKFGTTWILASPVPVVTSISVPDTSVSSVRHQYHFGKFGTIWISAPPVLVRLSIGTEHFGKFGTTAIPVPDTSVSSVRYQYRYRALGQVRYDINTGTSGTGMDVCTEVGTGIGTISTPVPGTCVHSVRHQPGPAKL